MIDKADIVALPERIILFCSYAYGTPAEASNVD